MGGKNGGVSSPSGAESAVGKTAIQCTQWTLSQKLAERDEPFCVDPAQR
jgi:hypothetical protein